MKFSIFIETGAENSVEVMLNAPDQASVFITAKGIDEAIEMVKLGEIKALAAPQIQPEDAPTCEQENMKQQENTEHYAVSSRSIEEMDEHAANYEASPAGQRFVKRIEEATAFTFRHSAGGLTISQLYYLASKHHNNLLNGSMDLTALAYRRGYKAGRKKGSCKNRG